MEHPGTGEEEISENIYLWERIIIVLVCPLSLKLLPQACGHLQTYKGMRRYSISELASKVSRRLPEDRRGISLYFERVSFIYLSDKPLEDEAERKTDPNKIQIE